MVFDFSNVNRSSARVIGNNFGSLTIAKVKVHAPTDLLNVTLLSVAP